MRAYAFVIPHQNQVVAKEGVGTGSERTRAGERPECWFKPIPRERLKHMKSARYGRFLTAILLVSAFLMQVANSASGAIVSVKADIGQIRIDRVPHDVSQDKVESDNTAWAFEELQCHPLTIDLPVTVLLENYAYLLPAEFKTADAEDQFFHGVVPAGTVVSSHYIFVDELQDNPGSAVVQGRVTFDAEIIAVISNEFGPEHEYLGNEWRISSREVGLPYVVYGHADYQGVEYAGPGKTQSDGDWWVIEPDGRTISFCFKNGSGQDNLRVITSNDENKKENEFPLYASSMDFGGGPLAVAQTASYYGDISFNWSPSSGLRLSSGGASFKSSGSTPGDSYTWDDQWTTELRDSPSGGSDDDTPEESDKTVVVPEPSGLAILGLGLIIAGWRRKRR